MGDPASERVTTIERLLDEVESLPDPQARELATNLVAELLELYGEGLARVMDRAGDPEANGLARELAEDELVSHLLLVHGLHPVPIEELSTPAFSRSARIRICALNCRRRAG